MLACVAGVLAAGALTGCTESNGVEPIPAPSASGPDATAEPTEGPPGEPTGGPTETATPEPPEVVKPTPPDAMRRDDVAGAEAAAVYFTELYPYVYATGDLAEWKAMSHSECKFCASVVENVEKLRAAEQHLEGGAIGIVVVDGREPLPDNEFYRVDVHFRQGQTFTVDREGRTPRSKSGEALLIYAVHFDKDRWIIRAGQAEDSDFDG